MTPVPTSTNALFYGDNLDILRKHIADASVDLIYLDPPFNSNRSYNVLFKTRSGEDAQAQVEAFDDTWTWSQQAEAQYQELIGGGAPVRVADAIEAMRRLLGSNDVLAYLVMMTARLVELHRVLKPTGTLWLHCDPTASHYLKVMLDAVFGGQTHYLNEIVWCYRDIGSTTTDYFKRKHDVIFSYAKGSTWTHNVQRGPIAPSTLKRYGPYFDSDGRITYRALQKSNPGVFAKLKGVPEDLDEVWLDKDRGAQLTDWWTDISALKRGFQEALGYPTQKPVALLERIIQTGTNPGDLVLDPFCGCGTTVDAAQKHGRRWIGIDVTYIAVDLIDKRLRATFGEEVAGTYKIHGIPHDLDAARALFAANPFDFERWAVSLVDGQPNQKQVGDKGIDGVIRFPIDNKTGVGRALVSVKGGGTVNPAMVRDLVGTVEQEKADMGVFICLSEPTKGMVEVANGSGSYAWPVDGRTFPKVQLITITQLLAGQRPKMPTPYLPYMQAKRLTVDEDDPTLF